MKIVVKHSFSGKEPLQKALIEILAARIQQIGSVDSVGIVKYDGETQNKANDDEQKEGVA